MLGKLHGVKDYRDVHPLHGQNELIRRRNRAREDAAWRRAEFVEPTRSTYPDTSDREYWNSLFNDENAPTREVWRALVEDQIAVYSLPIGYDGTWRCG
jgi:hypothetical protein